MSNFGPPSGHQAPNDRSSCSPPEPGPTQAPSFGGGTGHQPPFSGATDPLTAERENYHHDGSLDQNHIRLLKILRDDSHETVHCNLETYPLTEAPTYNALSYTWGDGEADSPIVCCGKKLNITRSLRATLFAIRQQRSIVRPTPHELAGMTHDIYALEWLWIDQICINQDDVHERERQVRIMQEIYRRAEFVLISLGEDFAGPGATISKSGLFAKIDRIFLGTMKNPSLKGCFPNDKTLVDLGLPDSTNECWSALETMLSMPYFKRVWVVQEVISAKEAIIIFEGGLIRWGAFLKAMFWFFAQQWDRHDASLDATDYAVPREDVLDIYLGFSSDYPSMPKSIYYLARRLRELRSKEPKDKIFALAGIADDGNKVAIDYKTSDEEVFEDFARYTISAEKNLKILSDVTHDDQNRVYTPSWVPRWNAPSSHLYPDRQHSGRIWSSEVSVDPQQEPGILKVKGKDLAVVADRVFRIDFDYSEKYEWHVVDMALSLLDKGFLTDDTLEASESSAPYTKRITELASCIIVGEYASLGQDETHSGDGANYQLLHDFTATLVDGLFLAVHKNDENAMKSHIRMAQIAFKSDSGYISSRPNKLLELTDETRNWVEGLKIRLCALAPSLLPDRSSVDELIDNAFRIWDRDRAVLFDRSKFIVTASRSFFITQDDYMGVGPPNLEEHDVICVLYGGLNPYALRPTSPPGSYTFLGDCYIPRQMDSEQFLKSGRQPDKWFKLM